MKNTKTFKVASLFWGKKYTAICSDKTGEIIGHIDDRKHRYIEQPDNEQELTKETINQNQLLISF